MKRNKYLDISLSDEEIESEDYKVHIGSGEHWEERGEFQLKLMKHLGLEPHHRFIDYGCGPIRSGRYFIRHQDPGRYFGCDVNADFVRIAQGIVDETPALSAKQPVLRHSPDFLKGIPEFDFMLFYSVLNFCTKRERKKVFALARKQPVSSVIWISHATWIDRMDPEVFEGVEIIRLLEEDIPAEMNTERKAWKTRDRMFPIVGLRRANA